VRESGPRLAICAANAIDNTCTVQRPDAKMANQDRHDRSDLDARLPRKKLDPSELEVLPRHESGTRAVEIRFAPTDRNDASVEAAVARPFFHDPDWTIRQRQLARIVEEA